MLNLILDILFSPTLNCKGTHIIRVFSVVGMRNELDSGIRRASEMGGSVEPPCDTPIWQNRPDVYHFLKKRVLEAVEDTFHFHKIWKFHYWVFFIGSKCPGKQPVFL
jgi:hypothetical protein